MTILEEFVQAIVLQQKKADESFDKLMLLPLQERVAKGVTMSNVKVIFDFYDHYDNPFVNPVPYPYKFIRSAQIICNENISKFREGGTVVLSKGEKSFTMEIIEDSIEKFILASNKYEMNNCYLNTEDYDENNWEINEKKTNITLRLLRATAINLSNDNNRLEIIEQLLSGKLSNPESSFDKPTKLNKSQNIAIERAFTSKYFHLIQGPPGTGKTETIAHLAKLLVDSGKKVFISAPTHTAINNCINAISKQVKDKSKLIKIGEKHQATELLNNEYITRKTRLPKSSYENDDFLSHNGIIIGGTPYSLCYPAGKRLNFWEFDVALIDEAAQMSIPLAISVMSKTNKFIFVGDHKQLDPIMPSGTNNSMFKESIFAKLVNLYPENNTLLNISYRLNKDLIRIPNALFYDNQLKSDTSLNTTHKKLNSQKYSEVLNNNDPKILYLLKVFDGIGRSPHEAKIVSELVYDLVSNNIEISNIGILTPYRAQVREIKKSIDNKIGKSHPEYRDDLFIDTVDRMQGQERDYIIYSMSNSHPLESKRRLDFFYSPNRLNVAITRGIKKCIVIANYKVFDIIDEELSILPDYWKLKSSLDTFKDYFKLATIVEEKDTQKKGW